MKYLIGIIAGIVAIGAVIWHAPRCKPGDPAFFIGSVMPMAGCVNTAGARRRWPG